jgi:DNA-binding response OmpR family regulator
MNLKNSVLVIDDDIEICELLIDILEEHGYTVSISNNAQQAKDLLSNHHYDLIFLDLILPDMNGLILMQYIKSLSNTPVIMLSGLGSDSDVIVGLEVGADDYIPKPFHPRVVIARAKAVIRRYSPTITPLFKQGFQFNHWFLDTEQRKLFSPNNNEVELTQGEYILLKALITHSQKILSRQKLLDLTHSENDDIIDRTIDVLIMRLRKKIEINAKQPEIIKTIRGEGYLFSCPVEIFNHH